MSTKSPTMTGLCSKRILHCRTRRVGELRLKALGIEPLRAEAV